jgi:hypothetical protein
VAERMTLAPPCGVIRPGISRIGSGDCARGFVTVGVAIFRRGWGSYVWGDCTKSPCLLVAEFSLVDGGARGTRLTVVGVAAVVSLSMRALCCRRTASLAGTGA